MSLLVNSVKETLDSKTRKQKNKLNKIRCGNRLWKLMNEKTEVVKRTRKYKVRRNGRLRSSKEKFNAAQNIIYIYIMLYLCICRISDLEL